MSGIDALTPEENGVLALVSDALFSSSRIVPSDADWLGVWRECYMQGVGSLAFSHTDASCLDDKTAGLIKKTLKNRLLVNISVSSAHALLHSIMTRNGIPYVILKGCVSALYYPDPVLRDMGDIDFLVPERYFESAVQALVECGFSSSHENHEIHTVFEKDSMRFELHRRPSGIPTGEPGKLIKGYFSDIFEKSTVLNTRFGSICVPSAFHHGLILLIHSAHHLTGEGLGLRHLCDWAAFENSFDENEFVLMFRERLEKVGLWNFACVLTEICVEYLGADERVFCREADGQLCGEILRDIFSGGNFGQKNSDRAHEALIMPGAEEQNKRSGLRRLFSSANRIVCQHWSIAAHLKFLLPVGWLFFGGRYILRSIFGKRPKINILSVSRETDERTAVYGKLKLYDTSYPPK